MKKVIFSLFIFSQMVFSQKEKSVGEFSKVTSFDQIEVVLIQSDENKVVLSGEGSENIEIVNKNGELKIRLPLLKMMRGEGMNATVYYKKIDAVEANEGSHIVSDEIFTDVSFSIIAKEGADIRISVEVENLNSKVESGGKVSVDGVAINQSVLVNTGGFFDATKLTTKQTGVTVNAGGEVGIYASDFVDAKVRAGGKVIVFGKPKQINKKVIAGGSIEEAGK
jgi:Putative auto-transporter adhesin, head GIN domain